MGEGTILLVMVSSVWKTVNSGLLQDKQVEVCSVQLVFRYEAQDKNVDVDSFLQPSSSTPFLFLTSNLFLPFLRPLTLFSSSSSLASVKSNSSYFPVFILSPANGFVLFCWG